jgi:hydroxymethylpyrimidine/phosphomethylpyrimidine kinase
MIRVSPPCVVTIAGTDPSGGAGIQADIKAISATGSYAASIITALVAQNTCGVQDILTIPTTFLRKQIDAVFNDLDICAVKIGMLHNTDVIDVVASTMASLKPKYVVLDPVMVAKNGCPLINPNTIDCLKQQLLPYTTLITPNIPEAEALSGDTINSPEAMTHVAKTLGARYQINVLIKGGHLSSDQSSDVLYAIQEDQQYWFHTPRIETKNTHGTGCTLSSAIASYLAQDYSLHSAIQASKNYLTHAITSASTHHIGQGHGPVDHFYFLKKQTL